MCGISKSFSKNINEKLSAKKIEGVTLVLSSSVTLRNLRSPFLLFWNSEKGEEEADEEEELWR